MQAVAETVERFGGLDVAVANAGIAQSSVATVRGISGEEWEAVVDVNLIGAWQTAGPPSAGDSERGGQIVFIGSISQLLRTGCSPAPDAVSKAGSRRSAGAADGAVAARRRAPSVVSLSAWSTP